MLHLHEEGPVQVFNRYRREAIALKRMRPHEHFGLVDFLRLYVSNVMSDARHAVGEGVPLRVWPSVLWFRFMQFWGTYRGFTHRGPLSQELKQAFYYPRGSRAPSDSTERSIEPIDYSKTYAKHAERSVDPIDYSGEPSES